MNLRNLEGASRMPISARSGPLNGRLSGRGERTPRSGGVSSAAIASNTGASTAKSSSAPPGASRGPFFDMMVAAQQAAPASTPATGARVLSTQGDRRPGGQPSGVRILSTDQVSAVRGASRVTATVRNTSVGLTAQDAIPTSATATAGQAEAPPPAQTPVEAINGLLTKLGFDPAGFNARVTSSTISVPGLSYEYPLLEVTVNGERVGFHLPSAMKDPRMMAANISSMMGRPVMDLSVFA